MSNQFNPRAKKHFIMESSFHDLCPSSRRGLMGYWLAPPAFRVSAPCVGPVLEMMTLLPKGREETALVTFIQQLK